MDDDTREQFRLLWKQGIDVLRKDIVSVKQHVDNISADVSKSRRWFVGTVVMAVPAYGAAAAELFMRR